MTRQERRRRRRAVRVSAIVASTVLGIVVVVAVTVAGGHQRTANSVRGTAGSASPVRAFSLATVGGARFVSPAGAPVIVGFMTTGGCVSCAEQALVLDQVQREFGARVKVLGVEIVQGMPTSLVRSFSQSLGGLSYPLAVDRRGALLKQFDVGDVGMTVLLDAKGHVLFRGLDPDTDTLRALLPKATLSST